MKFGADFDVVARSDVSNLPRLDASLLYPDIPSTRADMRGESLVDVAIALYGALCNNILDFRTRYR